MARRFSTLLPQVSTNLRAALTAEVEAADERKKA